MKTYVCIKKHTLGYGINIRKGMKVFGEEMSTYFILFCRKWVICYSPEELNEYWKEYCESGE